MLRHSVLLRISVRRCIERPVRACILYLYFKGNGKFFCSCQKALAILIRHIQELASIQVQCLAIFFIPAILQSMISLCLCILAGKACLFIVKIKLRQNFLLCRFRIWIRIRICCFTVCFQKPLLLRFRKPHYRTMAETVLSEIRSYFRSKLTGRQIVCHERLISAVIAHCTPSSVRKLVYRKTFSSVKACCTGAGTLHDTGPVAINACIFIHSYIQQILGKGIAYVDNRIPI